MKSLLIAALAASLVQVTFVTNLHCGKCAEKIRENVSFEKGIKALDVNAASKTVTITFNPAKTDTLKLGNSIRKLGYSAKAVEMKEIK